MAVNDRLLDLLGSLDKETPGERETKPASFSANLRGNQTPATIDTHNFRLPGILAGDPRFLETTVSEQADNVPAGLATLMRQYPGLPEDVAASAVGDAGAKGARVNYRPQEWVSKGYIGLDDATGDAGLWTAKPKDNEYGYYERWQQEQARKYGITPAQYQASMWLGGGDTTGLGSAAEPFAATLDARVRYTAEALGVDVDRLLDMYLKGEVPLLAEGGSVDVDQLAGRYGV